MPSQAAGARAAARELRQRWGTGRREGVEIASPVSSSSSPVARWQRRGGEQPQSKPRLYYHVADNQLKLFHGPKGKMYMCTICKEPLQLERKYKKNIHNYIYLTVRKMVLKPLFVILVIE